MTDRQSNAAASPVTVLIIGCGYLGGALARIVHARGERVLASTRSAQRAGALASAGIETVHWDLDAGTGVDPFGGSIGGTALRIVYLVPPGLRGAGTADPLAALQRAMTRLRGENVASAVLASSTAVYGDRGGATVSADTPACPDDERGRRLVEMEAAWLSLMPAARVVRLAGLYGPGRVIGRAGLQAGMPVGGDPDGWLNLVYVDDAARLLDCMHRTPADIELGCDDQPVRRRDYYGHLASLLGTQLEFAGAVGERLSRRCDNGPTRARTGWRPQAADYRRGLALALAGS
ncbi:MAG: hypothetical protein IT495_13285 [Gammaproteobacteria bacterium]|nr:hypothetical protein [Gammaproteobacteria bacterium]